MLTRLRAVNIRAAGVLVTVGIPYFAVSAAALAVICNRLSELSVLPEAMLWLCPWLVVFLLLGLCCKNSEQYLFICSMVFVCLAVFGGSLAAREKTRWAGAVVIVIAMVMEILLFVWNL